MRYLLLIAALLFAAPAHAQGVIDGYSSWRPSASGGGCYTYSDDFSTGSLCSQWTATTPLSSTITFDNRGGEFSVQFNIGDSDYDCYNTTKTCPRIMQSMANGDFVLAARWLTTIGAPYSGHGFIVEQDSTNWIRFDMDNLDNNASVDLYAASTASGSTTTRCQVLNRGTGPFQYIRLTRATNTWTFEYSTNGTDWTNDCSFSHTLTVTAVGPYANTSGGSDLVHFPTGLVPAGVKSDFREGRKLMR